MADDPNLGEPLSVRLLFDPGLGGDYADFDNVLVVPEPGVLPSLIARVLLLGLLASRLGFRVPVTRPTKRGWRSSSCGLSAQDQGAVVAAEAEGVGHQGRVRGACHAQAFARKFERGQMWVCEVEKKAPTACFLEPIWNQFLENR